MTRLRENEFSLENINDRFGQLLAQVSQLFLVAQGNSDGLYELIYIV